MLSPTAVLVVDTWLDVDSVWAINGTVTRDNGYKWITRLEEGKHYTVEKILDPEGALVGAYCDITSPIRVFADGYEYDDWYLDVFWPAEGSPQLLDEDEFEAAVEAGYLTPDQAVIAKETAARLMEKLDDGFLDLHFTTS